MHILAAHTALDSQTHTHKEGYANTLEEGDREREVYLTHDNDVIELTVLGRAICFIRVFEYQLHAGLGNARLPLLVHQVLERRGADLRAAVCANK